MADNINVKQGGETFMATDFISEVHHPRVKIQIGEDGTAQDVSPLNPIPASIDGVAKEAKQDIANSFLESLDDKLPDLQSGRIPVDVGGATVNITGPVTVQNEVEIKNDSGNPIPVTESLESYVVENNSSSIALGSNGTFTGEAFEVTKYSVINVNVFSDVSSAIDGVKVQFSPDGNNWDHEHKTSYSSGSGIGFIFNAEFKFARVVYINGATAQTAFRLQTIAKKNYTESSLYTLDQTVKGSMFSKLVKAALTAKKPNGEYASIDSTAGGNLKVSIEEVEGTLPVSTGLSQPLTDTQLRANPVNVNNSSSVKVDVFGTPTNVSRANPMPSIIQYTSSGFLRIQTNSTGGLQVTFPSQPCKTLTISNQSGVIIELFNSFDIDAEKAFYLPSGGFLTIRGINSAADISLKRLDNLNAQVYVTALWEN